MLIPGIHAICLSCEWERDRRRLPPYTRYSWSLATLSHFNPHTAHVSPLSVTSSHSHSHALSHLGKTITEHQNWDVSTGRMRWRDLSLDNVWSKCTQCLCSPQSVSNLDSSTLHQHMCCKAKSPTEKNLNGFINRLFPYAVNMKVIQHPPDTSCKHVD